MLISSQRDTKIVFLMICYCVHVILGGSDQRRLLKYLMSEKQYDPLERPVQNDSETLPVTMNLALQQIISFDGKNEVIIISGWLVLTWKDYSLTWNPEEYDNIQTIRLPSANIWIPDILLYNSADDKFDGTMKVNAVIQHTGDVLYAPPGIFKSICPFDIAAFPFDTQYCKLKFGSWTFDDSGINLTAESNKGQLDAYVKNAEWELEDFSAAANATKYDCCPTLYPYVMYTIRIRRRYLYYFTNIVVPCFLISCMTILGFLLAPESGEKLTLQITILLSIVMFSLLLSDILPPSSNAIPIISIYFMCVMSMSSMSVLASVVVISLHHRNAKSYEMPIWMNKYICYYLAWLLRMKRPNYDLTWRGICRKWTRPKQRANNISESIGNHQPKSPSVPLINNNLELLSSNGVNANGGSSLSVDNRDRSRSSSLLNLIAPHITQIRPSDLHQNFSSVAESPDVEIIRSELRTIISQLGTLSRQVQRQEEYDDLNEDWRYAGAVIDRLCLFLFTASMIIFTLLTLFSTPMFSKSQRAG